VHVDQFDVEIDVKSYQNSKVDTGDFNHSAIFRSYNEFLMCVANAAVELESNRNDMQKLIKSYQDFSNTVNAAEDLYNKSCQQVHRSETDYKNTQTAYEKAQQNLQEAQLNLQEAQLNLQEAQHNLQAVQQNLENARQNLQEVELSHTSAKEKLDQDWSRKHANYAAFTKLEEEQTERFNALKQQRNEIYWLTAVFDSLNDSVPAWHYVYSTLYLRFQNLTQWPMIRIMNASVPV
jgi:chromosome segregation ATPase